MKKVFVFGSSRLHRPFCKRENGMVVNNIKDSVEVNFSKLGYFHTAFEMLQAIKFLKDNKYLPIDIRQFIFRVEPRATTPNNEFPVKLEEAIKLGKEYNFNFNFSEITHLILEISSLSVNIHYPSGYFLHTNPNFQRNIPYKDIYPEGYYSKYEQSLIVKKYSIDEDILSLALIEIKKELPDIEIVVMGHLCSELYPHAVRAKVNKTVETACKNTNCFYFDTAPFLDKYGFNIVNDVTDIHHLSADGEAALGISLQEYILLSGKLG